MATTDYITDTELKAALEITGTRYDGDIPRAIHAASRAVDGLCNRRFYKDDDALQLRYYRLRASVVALDDVCEITEVAVSTSPGTYSVVGTAGVDYEVEPLNAVADSRPWTLLRAIGWWPGYKWCPPIQLSTLRIKGRYGWPTIPSQVPQATSILAAKLLVRTRQAPFGIVTAGAEVGVAMRIAAMDPDVLGLLEELIKFPLII